MLSLVYLSKIRQGQIDAFNAERPRDDAECDRLAEATFYKTEAQIAKTPIRTKDDALVALDLIWEELEVQYGSYLVAEGILKALRRYIEKSW